MTDCKEKSQTGGDGVKHKQLFKEQPSHSSVTELQLNNIKRRYFKHRAIYLC